MGEKAAQGLTDLELDDCYRLLRGGEVCDLSAASLAVSLIRARRAVPIGLRSLARAISRSICAADSRRRAFKALAVSIPMCASPS